MSETPTTLLSRAEINRRALATEHLMSTLGRRVVIGGVIAVAGQWPAPLKRLHVD